ncbi:hypothetical protein B0H15DRAFT_854506 [Mycena belliarum]|uniref:Mug135-like C-terminal domain-containing protein n=1 Tax=Mycena belliarum TaxID=1033014 RepID=A0AAD6TY52_9AGAR|nr:hypothetical protein B0H15DRAFT_854506 [Mycena belliae]
MAAALPPLPQRPLGLPAHGVPPPTAPAQNPPTLADVTNAHDYNERLQAAKKAVYYSHAAGNLGPTAVDIAEGLMYEKAIMELVGGPGAMPAWFQAWDLNHFQPLVINGQCATGHPAAFEVVPFVSGDDPTAHPHNLPVIENITRIGALTPQELTSYLGGYALPAQGNPTVRIRRLARHLGYFGEL